MKIAQVFSILSLPHGGGTAFFVYNLSRALAQRGHEVTIYSSDYELDPSYVNPLPGLKVHAFHSWINLPGMYLTPGMIATARNEICDYDVIHFHVYRSLQNVPLYHYARKYHIPYIVNAHGSLPLLNKAVAKKLYDIAFGNSFLKNARMLISETQRGADEYLKLGVPQEKVAVIPLAFPAENYDKLPSCGNFRMKYHIKNKRVVMFLGRIHWIKGIDFLIEAFNELLKKRRDVILAIVGSDDGHKSALLHLIKKLNITDNVIFTGFLGGQEKLEALVDADVVVQPSRYEHCAGAPFEAVLCGTPVIVTAHTGSGEDVKRLDAGYLVQFGNKKELFDCINKVITDPSEARAKASKAAQQIRSSLTIDKKAADYDKVYRQCIPACKNNKYPRPA